MEGMHQPQHIRIHDGAKNRTILGYFSEGTNADSRSGDDDVGRADFIHECLRSGLYRRCIAHVGLVTMSIQSQRYMLQRFDSAAQEAESRTGFTVVLCERGAQAGTRARDEDPQRFVHAVCKSYFFPAARSLRAMTMSWSITSNSRGSLPVIDSEVTYLPSIAKLGTPLRL